jgi:hypothetical protein
MSKSMSNLSDKEIDRLSRDAAEFYEPGESTISWNKLEQKLAAEMPERPPDSIRFGRISPFIWGTAIMIVAGISIYSIKKIAYPESSTPFHQTFKKNSSDTKKDLTNHSAGKDERDIPSVPEESAEKEKSYLAEQALSTAQSGYRTGSTKKTSLVLTSSAVTSGLTSQENSPVFFTATEDKNVSSNSSKSYRLSLPALMKSNTRQGRVTGNDSLLNLYSGNKAPVPEKSLRINRSLNIGFFFGPDYTTAGGITNNDLGNNIGLTIGYYFYKNLSINSGIFYSNKFFWSKAPQVRPIPNNGFTYTYAPIPAVENVNGAVSLYEIPLTLRYDFNNTGKSKFFINAGFSSYLIQSQSYIYFYHSPSRSAAWKISDNSPSNYWFGVGDLSLGLEQDLGKGLSFQIEPFLRAPLREMGINNLKMTSYGVLLGFRFSPVLSKSKR